MSTWAIAAICAATAGILALGTPRLIRALPEPRDATTEAGEGPGAGAPAPSRYAAAAEGRWVLPLGVICSAGAAGALGLAHGQSWLLFVLVPLVPIGYMLALIDARTELLPRAVVVPVTLAVLAAFVGEWFVTGDLGVLVRAVLGLVVARTGLWVLWFVNAGLVGFGDVRLAALTGLVTARLGWLSFTYGLYGALALAFVFVLLRAAVTRRRLRGWKVAMGPFLVAGAWVGLLVGPLLGT